MLKLYEECVPVKIFNMLLWILVVGGNKSTLDSDKRHLQQTVGNQVLQDADDFSVLKLVSIMMT